MKKRNLALILALAMSFCISSCGGKDRTVEEEIERGNNVIDPLQTEVEETDTKREESYIPAYLTDFSVDYQNEYDKFRVFFGFKDDNHQYVKYSGVAKINIENENGENVYSKEHNVDEAMFSTYTRTITGNSQYLLCEIDIPVSSVQKGKTERGTVTMEFSNAGVTYGQMKESCDSLPVLTGMELADISYDKTFVLTKHYFSGGVMNQTKISSFEITNIEIGYDNELKVSCKVIGTVYGSNYCSFYAKCYDADGFVIGSGMIHEQVSDGETFRFEL